jgi:hypothetical protein
MRRLKLGGMLFVLGDSRLHISFCLGLVRKLQAFVGTPFCPLGAAFLPLLKPFGMIVVVGYVCPDAMVGAPLDGSAGDRILGGLAHLCVLPCVGWLHVAFACGFCAGLDSLVGGLGVGVVLELHLKTIHLSGECNNLGVSRAHFAPDPISIAVATEHTEVFHYDVIVGHLPSNPCGLCKTNVNCKEFVCGDFSGAKKFGKKLILLAEIFALFSIDFLLKFFKRGGKSMEIVVGGQEGHIFHLELKILHIDNQIWFHYCVNHPEESESLIDDVTGFSTLVCKFLLADKKGALAGGGDVVLDGVPDKAQHSAALLLETGDKARVTGGIDIKPLHGHVCGRTNSKNLSLISYEPRGKSHHLLEADVMKILDEIFEVAKVG